MSKNKNKFKVGDEVIVKNIAVGTQVNYKNGCHQYFIEEMEKSIGNRFTISGASGVNKSEFHIGSSFSYHKSWLKHAKSKSERIKDLESRVDKFDDKGADTKATKASAAFFNYQRLYKLADELNGDWKPDWSNRDQPKYFVRYSHSSNKYFADTAWHVETYCSIVFKSSEMANKACDILKAQAI